MKSAITINYAQSKIIVVSLAFVMGAAMFIWPASTAAAPFDTPLPPAPHRLQISAWMPTAWDGDAARASFDAHIDSLSVVSPFWYGVDADGALIAFAGSRDAELVHQARNAGVRVIPTITNQFEQERVHAILNDAGLAAAHRRAIVAEVERYDLDGVDLDYENLAAEDKELFSAWVQALADDLHARGRLLTVTVQPKTFDAAGWDGPGAQDYRALAMSADELRLMTYGWCWASGCVDGNPPGPIAPMHWMQQVIDYAKMQAPASRIVLGVNLYGYDWRDESKPLFTPLALADMTGEALVWEEADALRRAQGAEIQWWERDERGMVQEPWFSYADDAHFVIFANADSVAARAQLAATNDLRGIIFWRLGGEDPSLWNRLPRRVYRAWLPLKISGG